MLKDDFEISKATYNCDTAYVTITFKNKRDLRSATASTEVTNAGWKPVETGLFDGMMWLRMRSALAAARTAAGA